MIGSDLAHYRIVDKLGQGGMGEVYRAEDTKLGRAVAIKILPEVFTADPERRARFEREARLLAALNHANIAAIYSFESAPEQDPPVHFLVMELADGEDLAARIARGPIPVDEVLPIARQVAVALESAHEKGIIHRDLKPANVKVDAKGGIKVLDFGLAKALDPEAASGSGSGMPAIDTHSPTLTAAMTGANVLLGTAAYMSPEQATGKPVDKRSDIWAFGVLLWEMLTGKRLFAGDSLTDTLADVLRADIDLAALSRTTPTQLVELLHRCLERDPDKRLHDIADARLVIEDLEEGGWELPAAATPGAKGRLLGLGLGIVIGLVLGALATWLLAPPDDTPVAQASRFEISIPDAAWARPKLSPNGSKIAYTSERQLWVRSLDELEPRAIAGAKGAHSPFWSPDGRSLGFVDDGALWRIPIEGGSRELIADQSTGASGTAIWTPDEQIVFTTGGGGIYSIPVEGGEPREIVSPNESQVDFHELGVLPDDKGFLTVIHKTENQDFGNVTLIAGDTQEELVSVPGSWLGEPLYSPTGHVVYSQSGPQRISGIWAVPFSLERLTAMGDPFLLVRDALTPNLVGSTLVYTPDPTVFVNELVWVDRDGRVMETVGRARRGLVPSVALSPDGNRAAVSIRDRQDWNVWVFDLESGVESRVSFEEDAIPVASSWAPDGQRLAYAMAAAGDDRMIKIKAPDSSTQFEPITEGGFALDISPDGRYLVFCRARPGFLQDIWVRDLEQGTEEPFVASDGWDVLPAIAPDGRFIAYRSRGSIFVSRFPEGEPQWQVAELGGAPEWSADGSRLYYIDGDDLMEVVIEPGPPFRSSAPELLFSFRQGPAQFGFARTFGVDGHGERFLMTRTAGVPPGIVVYQNWHAALEH